MDYSNNRDEGEQNKNMLSKLPQRAFGKQEN